MLQWSISLLGPLEVRRADGTPGSFATDKARALLAYLAAHPNQTYSRSVLAGLLWPDQPEGKARQSLRQTLLYLRQTLGSDADWLQVDRETVLLEPDPRIEIDLERFLSLVQANRQHRHRRAETCLPCLRRWETIVSLYRGEFLAGLSINSNLFEEWVLLVREQTRRHAMEALTGLADNAERRDDLAWASEYVRRQIELEPWQEEAHRALMRLLALDGRRSAALAQYQTCRRILAQELGIEPTVETVQLEQQIRTDTLKRSPIRHNLPTPGDPFIGRQTELAELAERLADPDIRLITLLGPGGIGKTRLALQVAVDHVGLFQHGVYFVPLATASTLDQVISAIIESLPYPFPDSASRHNQDAQTQLLNLIHSHPDMLLVLDNIDQATTLAPFLADMLRRAPGVRLLITSQERLNLRQEWVYEISGLAYPAGDEPTEAPAAEAYSAVELFVQNVRRVRRQFQPQDEMSSIIRICRLVEGMPLALELAAAWTVHHHCAEIADQIAAGLDILTASWSNASERHRSIRAVLEHSWQLLSPPDQDILSRLAVFCGGLEAQIAGDVAAAAPARWAAALSACIDKSLLRRSATGRYDLHPLLRQFALDKLAEQPALLQETQTRFVRRFAQFLEQQNRRLNSAAHKTALVEIGHEIDNIRQSWQWAIALDDLDAISQSIEGLYFFFDSRGHFEQGIHLFAQALSQWPDRPSHQAIIGRTSSSLGALYYRIGQRDLAQAALERGLGLAERLNSPADQMFALLHLSNLARYQGHDAQSERWAARSLTLAQQIGSTWGITRSLFVLGMLAYQAGRADEAGQLFDSSLATARSADNPRLLLSPLNALGDLACYRGDYEQAQAFFSQALALSRELDTPLNIAMHLNNLGTVYHYQEQYEQAALLYQESLDISIQIGDPIGQALALGNLSEIALLLARYDQARLYSQKGLEIGHSIQDQPIIVTCLNNLGEIDLACGNERAAWPPLLDALRLVQNSPAGAIVGRILVNLALLFARQHQPEQAAALLTLARDHPVSEQYTQNQAARLLQELDLTPLPQPPVWDQVMAAVWSLVTQP